ncbi:MAG: TIGR03016 family PEP-CTERM system-associated outer membrane protein, partial [Gammaproteobacteria bacterium]
MPAAFSLLCCSAAVAEKNWSINPGITLSETYSDNVAPGVVGADKSEFITQINPGLQAELRGPRIQANLDYRMQNIIYGRNDESNTFHQYLARAGAEVLPEHFFVDVSASQTQRNISSDGLRFRRNYIITDNRTDQRTASIRPSWHQSIGSYAEALLDYEHGIVRYDENVAGLSDSSLDSASLAISSLSGERRLSWKIIAQGQNIVYEDAAIDDVELRNTGLLLGYRVLPGLSPLGLIGYEDNDFGNRLTETDPKGLFWALGFSWQPNARTELEALAGDRFFGNTYRLKWRQRGRYLSSELTYSEEINGEATSALEGISLIDSPYGYSNSSINLTDDLYLSKTVRAYARYSKARTLITIAPYFEKREFDNSAGDEHVGGITATWQRTFAPRTTITLTLRWRGLDALYLKLLPLCQAASGGVDCGSTM